MQISSRHSRAIIAHVADVIGGQNATAKAAEVIRAMVGEEPSYADLGAIDTAAVSEALRDASVSVVAVRRAAIAKVFTFVSESAPTCNRCGRFAYRLDGSVWARVDGSVCPIDDGLYVAETPAEPVVAWTDGRSYPPGTTIDSARVPITEESIRASSSTARASSAPSARCRLRFSPAKPAAASVAPSHAGQGARLPAAFSSVEDMANKIPIAVPIPFTSAGSATPGMLKRLQAAGGAASGLDPRAVEAWVRVYRLNQQATWASSVPRWSEVTEAVQQEARRQESEGVLAPADNPQLQRLHAIARRLIPQTYRWNERARNWRWQVNLIFSKQLNAFCMPGGKIAVYSGIIDQLALTDDELAMILGHEMAHALREHARERVAKTNATGIGLSIAAQLLGLGQFGDVAANLGTQLLSLKYSRDDETEADLVGLELAARAHVHAVDRREHRDQADRDRGLDVVLERRAVVGAERPLEQHQLAPRHARLVVGRRTRVSARR